MTTDRIVSNLQDKAFPSSPAASKNHLEFWTIECVVEKRGDKWFMVKKLLRRCTYIKNDSQYY